MTNSTQLNSKPLDLTKWISATDIVAKYPQFTVSMLKRLIWKRHENSFNHCCRVFGKRAFIHEDLLAEWILNHSDNQAA